MKKLVLAIVCVIISNVAYGQQMNNIAIDSLLRNQANLLPDKYKEKFDVLLFNKENKALSKRLDTIQFDYLIMEETFSYHNSNFRITELYYSKSDSLPKHVFDNGSKYLNPNANQTSVLVLYRTDLGEKLVFNKIWNSLLNNSSFQTLQYSEIQHFYGGCQFDARNINVKKVSRHHRKVMKSTYKIQILIDKTKNETKISFQIPPTDPRFIMVNGGYNWW